MSKQQWIGLVIVLLMVAAVELCVRYTHRSQQSSAELLTFQPEREQAFLLYLDSLDAAAEAARRAEYAARYPKPVIRLQPFDPNTADSTLLVTVGFKPWMAHNLIRYRNAGKVFRRPDELRRLYGMNDSLYSTLAPFIRIDTTRTDSQPNPYRAVTDSTPGVIAVKRDTILELNSADTAELMLLRGIGRYTATRIIRYRQALGGFYSVRQLYEVPELPAQRADSLLPHFVVDTSLITPVLVNRSSVKQLQRHPYISYPQAQQLYDLRRRKLRLSSVDELSAIFTPDELHRLTPYLRFDP
ncbi:MAG: helix-hairpin-helix domain-containing protein [Paludibacteraceae bacterium]|nr:helix-hairpin-helix domain-containing protein [Paludibacteraceae bacterium]